MEEAPIKSSELNPPESPNRTSLQSPPKAFRKGDKVYEVLDENITMLKDTASGASIAEPQEKLDEVASGESLFKTFAFDNAISQEETEKCVSFWRSVVEKNLEPVKCSLIENMADYQKQLEEKCKVPAKKNKRPSKNAAREDTSTDTKPKPNVWYEMLQELQKKRYKETKLLLEKRCRFCGYAASPVYQPEDPAQDNQKTIAELSTWKPRSHKRPNPLVKNIARPKSLESENPISKASADNSEEKPREIGPVQEKHSNDSQRADLLERVKKNSGKIQYVDAIERKKTEGAYGKWRKNYMKLCKCNRTDCDCTSTPANQSTLEGPTAGISTEPSSSNSPPSEPEHDLSFAKSSPHQDQSSFGPESIPITSEETQLVKTPDVEEQPAASSPYVVRDSDQPDKLTVLYKESDMSGKTNAQKPQQDQDATSVASENVSEGQSLSGYEAEEDVQLATAEAYRNIAPRKSILKSKEESEYSPKARIRKLLSVAIACCCSYPDCDCTELKEKISHEPLNSNEHSLEVIPKRSPETDERDSVDYPVFPSRASMVTKSVDSLELAKQRLSISWEEKAKTRGSKVDANNPAKSRNVSIIE